MRRNKKIKKNSVLTSGTVGVASLIVSALIMAMIYYVLDSRCDLINNDIGKAERRLKALESECVREAARWDEMKIPERLNEKLTRFGLEMRYPRQDQIVQMNADGRAIEGLAVKRRQQRNKIGDLALNSVSPATARSSGKRGYGLPSTKRLARR